MNIHEYQAKAVLREFGVPVPRGIPAFSVDEAESRGQQLGGPVWVVKAQIHAGGRGKAGGVKVVKSIADVKREATRLLGSTLVTHQTGPHGKEVNRLYIEEGSAIDREYYLSALVDRATSRVAFVVSTEGGMDIEEVAHKTPEKITSFSIDPATGFMPHHARYVVAGARASTATSPSRPSNVLPKLYQAFVAKDMSLLEINPLVVTKSRRADLPRRQDRLRRQRALSPPGHRGAARPRPRRTRRRSRRRDTISTMSRSTAPSAAWSTAPGSPWRPWTSSSSTARRRRTSSMSAAAPPRRRSPRRSRSSPRIRT